MDVETSIFKYQINSDLYFELKLEGRKLSIYSNGNISDEREITLTESNGIYIVKVGGLPCLTYDSNVDRFSNKRNLIPTAVIRNRGMIRRNPENISAYEDNAYSFVRKSGEESVDTELHTHFMEILSGEEFLLLMLDKIEGIYIDKNGIPLESFLFRGKVFELPEGASFISRKDILNNKSLFINLASKFTLPQDRQVPFDTIHTVLQRRNFLIEYYAFRKIYKSDYELDDKQFKANYFGKKNLAKTDLYIDILAASLKKLESQGIRYAEFSFSNSKTISNIFEQLKKLEHKPDLGTTRFNFLLSGNRLSTRQSFQKWSDELQELLDNKMVCGFDIMGVEQYISKNDRVPGGNLYDMIEPILKILNEKGNKTGDLLVLRLHAGEILYPEMKEEQKGNPEISLEIIDAICTKYGLEVPPPEIRLGHCLHFVPTANYLKLLRQYKVVVEINASSNFALGNDDSLKDIPYRWYVGEKIPVVISTDGGGFYLTDNMSEAYIARIFGGDDVVPFVKQIEEEELRKRGI